MELPSARRGLVAVSQLRIVEAIVALICALLVAGATGVSSAIVAISFGASLVLGFIGDQWIRQTASRMLGKNPVNSAPPAIRYALREAALPLGLDPSHILVRRIRGVGEAQHTGFAAGALPTRHGAVVMLGQVVAQRAREAEDRTGSEGERRFAYDELRAVLGHELAHIMPGTYSSARLPAVVIRASRTIVDVMFWMSVGAVEPLMGAGGAVATAFLRLVSSRYRHAKALLNAFAMMLAALVSVFVVKGHYELLVLFAVWPLVRPLSALAIQRRIEKCCDNVAIASGADPYALARILQRFEPDEMRYYRPPLWIALNQTHPPLHKRIVDLDHK